jgi:hypothetical protein
MNMSQIASEIIQSIKAYVDEKVGAFSSEIKKINEIVESFPIAEKGEAGKDADPVNPELIKELVSEAIKEIPAPQNGKDADPIDKAELQKMIDAAVEKSVDELAKQIPEPEKGQDGRDAADLAILPEIDQDKSYPRGTFAIHKGGLWRSFEKTKGMRGWETVVNGIADISIEYDGDRALSIKTEKSCGDIVEKQFHVPAMIYRDVYRSGESYSKGDTCTYAGSLYTCVNETQERPGTASKDWRLSAKRGRDGKDKN